MTKQPGTPGTLIAVVVVLSAALFLSAIVAGVRYRPSDEYPAESDALRNSYITLTHLRVDRPFVSGRDAIVVFANARSANGLTSNLYRYPRDRAVWLAQPGEALPMQPMLSFPYQRDVDIEVGVFVVPRTSDLAVVDALEGIYMAYMDGTVSRMRPQLALGELRDGPLAPRFHSLAPDRQDALAASWLVDVLRAPVPDALAAKEVKSLNSGFTLYVRRDSASR